MRANTSDCRLRDSSFNEPNGLCLINGDILLADTNNHCLKLLDLNNDWVTETKLFEVEEKFDSDSTDNAIESKFDLTFNLSPIVFSATNRLTFRLGLKSRSKLKLTEGMKNVLTFDNPGLNSTTYRSITHDFVLFQ